MNDEELLLSVEEELLLDLEELLDDPTQEQHLPLQLLRPHVPLHTTRAPLGQSMCTRRHWSPRNCVVQSEPAGHCWIELEECTEE